MLDTVDLLRSAVFDITKIIHFCTKQPILMRMSTVPSLPRQLVFPALYISSNCSLFFNFYTKKSNLIWLSCAIVSYLSLHPSVWRFVLIRSNYFTINLFVNLEGPCPKVRFSQDRLPIFSPSLGLSPFPQLSWGRGERPKVGPRYIPLKEELCAH